VNQLTAEERSKIIKLTEKHCKQMLDLIYKQKMAYFKSGGEDWREVLERSYPRDSPKGTLTTSPGVGNLRPGGLIRPAWHSCAIYNEVVSVNVLS
jgi:hypothetical protein